MSEYFQISQKIRKEIEEDSSLMGTIREIFRKRYPILEDVFMDQEIQPRGSKSMAYRVGKTQSGLYVALRLRVADIRYEKALEWYIRDFEMYCQVAEAISDRKNEYTTIDPHDQRIPHRSVSFCIGIVNEDRFGKDVGILTEDATFGGIVPSEITDDGDSLIIFEGNKPIEKVEIDLEDSLLVDDIRPIYDGGIRYFAEENVIKFNAES